MINKHIISGIQQIGIGVEDLKTSWSWYAKHLGMNVRVLEDDTVAELMLPYTGNKPHKRHAGIALNMIGGSGMEIWQYSDRKPQLIDFDIALGDLGVFCAKIKSPNIKQAYSDIENSDAEMLSTLHADITGKSLFYFIDPFKNMFQVIEDSHIFSNVECSTGGPIGAMIGVRDIEHSLEIYQNILGYNKIVYDKTGKFDDWSSCNGGNENYRRVLLTHSEPRKGGFSRLFGQSYIELVQALDRKPRKIYENRFWGDPGFIQICFDVRNMNALKQYCSALGYEFTVDSSVKHNQANSFDMGEAAGHFTYIEDPDGTLIEFVETHKIPIIKKIGWYLNLRNRKPEKPLPDFLLKMMRFNKVKY
jgi:catechol 2,3-dioxygenase-like lactoylglutathione lyase family enzyme